MFLSPSQLTLKEPVKCVTEHPDFDAVVLHPWVLKVAANGLRTRQGKRYMQLGSDENGYLRAIAYRLCISMVFGLMGFDNSDLFLLVYTQQFEQGFQRRKTQNILD